MQISTATNAISLFIPASLMMWDISMYHRELLHMVQNAIHRTNLFPDCFGNDDLRSIMLTMKFVAEDDREERSHLIVDFRIIGF